MHAPTDFLFVTGGCGLTVLTVASRSIHVSDLGTMHTNNVQWNQLKSFMLEPFCITDSRVLYYVVLIGIYTPCTYIYEVFI